jgi:hypothetical protein
MEKQNGKLIFRGGELDFINSRGMFEALLSAGN